MNSEKIFADIIDDINVVLDNIGLYVVDVNIDIQGKEMYEDFEDIRSQVINGQSSAFLDLKCFIGKEAWRGEESFPSLDDITYPDFGDLLLSDIGIYFEQE